MFDTKWFIRLINSVCKDGRVKDSMNLIFKRVKTLKSVSIFILQKAPASCKYRINFAHAFEPYHVCLSADPELHGLSQSPLAIYVREQCCLSHTSSPVNGRGLQQSLACPCNYWSNTLPATACRLINTESILAPSIIGGGFVN